MRGRARAALVLGAAGYFASALLWLGASRPSARPLYDEASAFDTSPGGLSLAYRYLAERPSRVLSRAVEPGALEADAVVLRVRPKPVPFVKTRRHGSALLTASEAEWVAGGGRLVLALAEGYGAAGVEGVASEGREVRKVYPLWPGVGRIRPRPTRALTGGVLEQAQAVLVLGERPIASRWTLGRGDVILLACPEVFENRLLGDADHLGLLEALSGRGRSVYFDEGVHGLGTEAGLIELLARWRLGPLLLLLSATGGVAFWRGRSRVGPEDADAEDARSEAVDLLESLAQIYDRALRRDEALALYHESLARAASLRTGLRGDALAARVRDLAGSPPSPRERAAQDLGLAEFARRLRTLNEGFRRLRHAEPG